MGPADRPRTCCSAGAWQRPPRARPVRVAAVEPAFRACLTGLRAEAPGKGVRTATFDAHLKDALAGGELVQVE